jgi:hypothetical protein
MGPEGVPDLEPGSSLEGKKRVGEVATCQVGRETRLARTNSSIRRSTSARYGSSLGSYEHFHYFNHGASSESRGPQGLGNSLC